MEPPLVDNKVRSCIPPFLASGEVQDCDWCCLRLWFWLRKVRECQAIEKDWACRMLRRVYLPLITTIATVTKITMSMTATRAKMIVPFLLLANARDACGGSS